MFSKWDSLELNKYIFLTQTIHAKKRASPVSSGSALGVEHDKLSFSVD